MTRPTHKPLAGPMYVTIGRQGLPPLSYTWRIWPNGTSFYMKSKIPGVKHMKLSIHGEDPRHPRGGGFKIAMDTEQAWQQDLTSGAVIGHRTGTWPIWFPGCPIDESATLVARLRWTHEATSRLGPAPNPGELKKNATGVAVTPPARPGDAVDVDLIISGRAPYWRSEPHARRDKACLGPLFNEATGLWLTGTAMKRFVPHYPHPAEALGPRPSDRDDQLRGVGVANDPDGFVWIIEHRISKTRRYADGASSSSTILPTPGSSV